jgi:hypothetical protein
MITTAPAYFRYRIHYWWTVGYYFSALPLAITETIRWEKERHF